MMFPLSHSVVDLAISKSVKIAIAESCTGGLLCGAITSISGSSKMFDGGFITYSDAAKTDWLGVDSTIIESDGAVSAPTAEAMALCLLSRTHCDLSLGITGIAGPGGGSASKPVGLVYVSLAWRGESPKTTKLDLSPGDTRESIRHQSVETALTLLHYELENYSS